MNINQEIRFNAIYAVEQASDIVQYLVNFLREDAAFVDGWENPEKLRDVLDKVGNDLYTTKRQLKRRV